MGICNKEMQENRLLKLFKRIVAKFLKKKKVLLDKFSFIALTNTSA